MKIFNKNFDTVPEANLKTRRILKGTLPPKNAENTGGISNSKDDDDDDDERHVLLVPLQQSEELEDKKEKLRKERLSLSSKVRKQHKEKELMEHRLRSGSVSSSSKNKSEEMENKENLPQFSVESKYPEHKRKNRGSDVGKGKKLRSDSSELPEDESNSRSRIGIITAVAVLAIIASKFMRK